MMRPSTVLWIALAGGVGVGVYQLKHRVQALEDDLFRLNRSIVQEQDSIHVLRAEWAYINQPQRLEALAQRHLSMQVMTPTQMGQVADLPRRPPPPPAPVTPPEPVLAALPASPPPGPAAAAPPAGAARQRPADAAARSAGAQNAPSQSAQSQTGASQSAPSQPPLSQTEARAPAEGRASAPAARASVPALAPNSRLLPASAQVRAAAEPSIADLLAAMRPPPASGDGDAYAGARVREGRASPPAARMPAPRTLANPDIQAAGGPAAVGGR
jgi:hypothetical protein